MNRIRSQGGFWGWGLALAGSVLLNFSLFGLMPGLIQRVPARPDTLEEIKHLQVIRVKKAETPPRKKTQPKKTAPEPVKEARQVRKTEVKPRPVKLTPSLAFELNPALPAAPTDLVLPDLEQVAMDVPAMKDRYDAGELDAPLMALVRMQPIYPFRARQRELEGAVTVEFYITKQGLVEQVRIVRSEPEDVFDNSVVQCVSQWKFKPGTVAGVPVAVRAETTIRFQLGE